ncbi:type II secretion system protein [Pedobacter sp.]|nr:type II secretion system protein [Candidatus Saccharibacteria bacterium]
MKTLKQRGFTIIEVVLVLAIAGLIFLVVFLAVPALQSSQRDQQRTSDLSRLQTSVENYRSNNKGTLPAFTVGADNAFMEKYLRTGGESFNSPSGDEYQFLAWTGTVPAYDDRNIVGTGNSNAIYIATGKKCATAEGTFATAGTRDYAVAIPLEGGGTACQNN